MTEIHRRVIGTAGHVDHGKTSLVKALTGTDCDRLAEEKRRGITISLGFASWSLGDELLVSVVDVPGHERFVNTMVSGASGLDAVMLVVAADDGVMPQTEEHLQICELLDVPRGIVAISKCDLADEETLELVREDVAQTVTGTFLEGAPVIPCSAATGQGLEVLTAAVRDVLEAGAQQRARGPAFLPVDRAFTKAGFGTVVTGTLLTGRLRVGDDVDALPGDRGEGRDRLRVRGLQIQEQSVEETEAGVRLAVNLRGPGCEEVRRGEVVVAAGSQRSTRDLHVELTLLPAAPVIEERAQLSLHLGAGAELVQLFPLGGRQLTPGVKSLARLCAEQPVAAYAGQRFVVRQPGRHGLGTIGGGRVLDPHPGAGKRSFERWSRVAQALTQPALQARVQALLEDAREAGASQLELSQRLPPGEDVTGTLAALATGGLVEIVEAGGAARYVSAARVDEVGVRVMEITRRFHAEHPVLSGVTPAELRSQLPPLAAWLTEAAIERRVTAGDLVRVEGAVALADHSADQGPAGQQLEQLAERYRQFGLTPPLDEELRVELGLKSGLFRDLLNELKRRGQIVRLADTLHFHRDALEALREKVDAHFQDEAELSPAQLKTMGGGLSRKYAIPLLEWLDSAGITVRKGGVRVARRR